MASISVSDDNNNQNPNQQNQESTIPVLTVLKNKAIIKNIIIVPNNNNNNDDHTLITVGRHPSCNIFLTHPSISRYHLKIRFTPFSRSISLLDTSSVHGTWVSGRKLEHGVSVDLKDGDSFQLGVSTRVYLLHFFSQFDVETLNLKNIGSLSRVDEMKDQSEDESFEVENDSIGTEISSCDGESKLCGCENYFLSPPYVHSVDRVDNSNSQIIEACPEVEMPGETNLLCKLREYLKDNICIPVVEAVQGSKLHQQSSVEKQWIDPAASFDEKGDDAVNVTPKESEFEFPFEDSDKIEDILTTGASVFNSEDMPESESYQTNTDEEVYVDSLSEDMPESESYQTNIDEEVSVDSLSDGEKKDSCGEEYYELELQNLNADSCHEQGYSLDEIVEDSREKCIENMDPAYFDENCVAAVNVTPKEREVGCIFEENESNDDLLTSVAGVISENMSSVVEETIHVTNFQQIKTVEVVVVDSLSDGEKQNKCDKEFQAYLNAAKRCDVEENSLDETVEDTVKSFQTESVNPSVPQEADLKITDKKEIQTLQSLVAVAESCTEESAKRSSTFGSDISSRRDKAASAPQDRIRKSRLLNTPNSDTKFEMSNLKDINILNKPMPNNLFSVLDEEEMFTPKKEFSSPTNTFQLQFMRKKGKLEESKSSKSQRSHNLKVSFSPNIYSAERSTSALSKRENQTPKAQRSHNLKVNFSPNFYSAERSTSALSNKENQTPKTQEWKSGRKPLEFLDNTELRKKRVERIPLQSLMNSGGNRNSVNSSPFSAAKTIADATASASHCEHISDKHTKLSHISGERKRSWDMIVDTASLMNKESRKALQLLQGLKGTRLIIPESVIRELGSMKQQVGIFRRISEAALALEWIQECIWKTKWWIHILDCGLPMVEDHILDSAIQYRREDNVGQIVLLSDDVNLKVKSMAKGLLCETVQQFRQSLVNPFSERFMWANSSPRGQTWSCQDDVVLREKYCGLPPKAGLKLLVNQKSLH